MQWRRRGAAADEARVAEIRSLVGAFPQMTHVENRDALASTISRIGCELTRGTGAALFQRGPGRTIALGHFGIHPAAPDPELGVVAGLDRVLRGGRVQHSDPLLIPLTGANGVVAALSVASPQRALDPYGLALLAVFGWSAGQALDRFDPIIDVLGRDPLTGVGDQAQGTAALAAIETGDGVVLYEVAGIADVRRDRGDDAADLLQVQLGLHLRNAIRPGDAVARSGDDGFVVVLREVRGPVDMVVRRVLDTWAVEHPGRAVYAGAALHTPGAAPIDTFENARADLHASKRSPTRPG